MFESSLSHQNFMLLYNEYGGLVRISETDAISQSKEYAASKGFSYINDQEALEDFIILHWAWEEK